MPPFAEYDDVQGLARFAHSHLTEACYLLVRIVDIAAARAWLLSAPVTPAVKVKPPGLRALQIAFTADGLRALGLGESAVQSFAPEFVGGMDEESRARRLGDVGDSEPARWTWGTGARRPHVAIMLFAASGDLDAWQADAMDGAAARAFRTIERLGTSNLGGVEPFSFVDGISQPEFDWDQLVAPVIDELQYTNRLQLGELLLGYRNEYGKWTRRPLVTGGDGAASALPRAEDEPDRYDVGRNGTYVVVRELEQDVRRFWRSVADHATAQGVDRQELAESMVGRRMNGDPLVPATAQNGFTYEADPDGARCPLGAHIRRANPRNADFPPGSGGWATRVARRAGFLLGGVRADLLASTRFHRVLRRGREYGPRLTPEEALQPAPPGDPPRGLQFVCLNANLSRQFEFVQGAWLLNATFDGTHGESDPIIGNRARTDEGAPTDGFSRQRPGTVSQRFCGIPPFVTVKGGAYFFMPGLRALRYLAGAGAPMAEVSR